MAITSNLIPRRIFFCDPDRTAVSLSPDGHRLAWLEPRNNVLNLMISCVGNLSKSLQVTRESTRSLAPVLIWAHTNKHVIVFRDQNGDENYRAFSIDLETYTEVPLTPSSGIRSFHWCSSRKFPTEMLFGINARDRRFFDVAKVDILTGRSEIVFENPGFTNFKFSANFAIQFAERVLVDGSAEILERQSDDTWKPFLEITVEDVLTTKLDQLSADGRSAFLLDSRERDKVALFEVDLATRAVTLLAEDSNADLTDVVYHPVTKRPLAAIAVAARQRWHPIDFAFSDCLERLLCNAGDAELTITDISDRGDRIVTFVDRSDRAGEYRLFDQSTMIYYPLFKNRSDIENVPLRPMQAVTIPARDGLMLSSYLSLPNDEFQDGPMIVVVHGGPYARDVWGYSDMHQWLVNRGYAVMSVNYRGSIGFGKAFLKASDQEWGGRMQDDLIDAVTWSVGQGFADPARIALFGASYGGYAALMGATKTPEIFACIVDAFGPSNLVTFMQNIPPYWQTWFAKITHRLADPTTEEGRSWLLDRSPLTHVDRIARPLLIIQGLNDVRVKQQEAEQIVHAMKSRGIPVIYVTFSDEGHYLVRQENRIAYSAVIETFFAKHLGGLAEPIADAFKKSSIQIEVGKDLILNTSSDSGK